MKSFIKSLLITLSFFLVVVVHAQLWKHKKVVGNGNLTTEITTTPSYDQLKVVGFMDVKLVKGKEGEIVVKADENLQNGLELR